MTTNNSNSNQPGNCGCQEPSEFVTGLTRAGKTWTPHFIESLNQENCAGCGRCYKACLFRVFDLIDHPDGDYVGGAKVMSIAHPENCIGCAACQKACIKKNPSCRPLKKEEMENERNCP